MFNIFDKIIDNNKNSISSFSAKKYESFVRFKKKMSSNF